MNFKRREDPKETLNIGDKRARFRKSHLDKHPEILEYIHKHYEIGEPEEDGVYVDDLETDLKVEPDGTVILGLLIKDKRGMGAPILKWNYLTKKFGDL